jgi:hypothetical protein
VLEDRLKKTGGWSPEGGFKGVKRGIEEENGRKGKDWPERMRGEG